MKYILYPEFSFSLSAKLKFQVGLCYKTVWTKYNTIFDRWYTTIDSSKLESRWNRENEKRNRREKRKKKNMDGQETNFRHSSFLSALREVLGVGGWRVMHESELNGLPLYRNPCDVDAVDGEDGATCILQVLSPATHGFRRSTKEAGFWCWKSRRITTTHTRSPPHTTLFSKKKEE